MYETATYSSLWVGFILGIILIGILVLIIGSRTKTYRKDLTNLYVAARIRQLAKADDLDLVEEYEVFKKYSKKRRLEDKDLDATIESELKDRVEEGIKKKPSN